MEHKNEIYLAVLSVLLGISVLKLTEVFQLGGQLKTLLDSLKTPGLSLTVIGVFLFVGGYLIFFVLLSLASYGITVQLIKKDALGSEHPDLGPIVGMCVAVLAVSYLIVFALVIYGTVPK